MTDYPSVPTDLQERMAAARDVSDRGVGEVFADSHLRAGCPDCGSTMFFTWVYYTVDGDTDVPVPQQDTPEVAHEYICHEHDEQYRWLVNVENGEEWYLAGIGDT